MTSLNFTPFPNLITERLQLRQMNDDDEQAVFRLRSDKEVIRYTPITRAVTSADAALFIKRINDSISKNESILWAITEKPHGSLIGTICLFEINPEKSQAEVGYMLLPEMEGQGIMQEALTAVVNYGFTTLQLTTILAIVEAVNLRSLKLLERTGFSHTSNSEGLLVYSKNQ